jgi:hypothetical protein
VLALQKIMERNGWSADLMKQDTGPEYGRGKCLFAATKFECDGDVTYY